MIYSLVVPCGVKNVSEVRVLEWHGAPGTAFSTGDMLVELETHKAVVEVRAGAPAILRRILCEPGDWQVAGAALAVLSDDANESLPDSLEQLEQSRVTYEVL
jgi:pyruvate/2-oxoglutarate dehydrogenase complex dihydrolipoamide acyltransferase (E2) component